MKPKSLPKSKPQGRSVHERDKAIRWCNQREVQPAAAYVLKTNWIDCPRDAAEVREILNRNKK